MINNPEEQYRLKGLRVLEELPVRMLTSRLIEFLSPPDPYPSFVPAKWHKAMGENIDINLLFANYIYPNGRQVSLYCFPEAIEWSLRIENLESSIETIGFIVLVDIETFQELGLKIAEERSAIDLAKSYHLLTILAVINARIIERDTEKLSQLIDYSPDMPIVWCDGDMNFDFVQRTMDTIYPYI